MSLDYHDVPHSVRVALSHLQSSPAPSHFSMISDNPSPQQEVMSPNAEPCCCCCWG